MSTSLSYKHSKSNSCAIKEKVKFNNPVKDEREVI